jgi:hypothetical protein
MSRPTDQREVLGEVRCVEPGCGGVEYVYRSKRKGRHLYGRCANCGINQKTGKAAQERLAQFQPVGSLAAGPSQTDPEPTQTALETVPATEPATVDDFDPTHAPMVPDRATDRPRTGPWGLVLGLLFLLSVPLAFLGAAAK